MYLDEQMSVTSIAHYFGTHYETMKSALRRQGIKLKPRGRGQYRKATKTQVLEAVASYEAGTSCDDVAEKYGVTRSAVLRWVRDCGGEVRPAGFQTGENHHGWNGGRTQAGGYLQILVRPDDPLFCMGQKKNGPDTHRYVLEHRYVMAQHLGRPLEDHETVHHIDLDKKNNEISNLQLRIGKHGKGACFRCVDCGSYNIQAAKLH